MEVLYHVEKNSGCGVRITGVESWFRNSLAM